MFIHYAVRFYCLLFRNLRLSFGLFNILIYKFWANTKILCGSFPLRSWIVLSRNGPIPGEDISLAAQFSSTRADKPFPERLLLYYTTRISLRTGSFCGLENRTNSQIFNLVLLSTKLKFWHSAFFSHQLFSGILSNLSLFIVKSSQIPKVFGVVWHLLVALFNH